MLTTTPEVETSIPTLTHSGVDLYTGTTPEVVYYSENTPK